MKLFSYTQRLNPVMFLFTEVLQEMSHVCVVKVENISRPCQDLAAQDHHSPPLLGVAEPTSEHFTIKQENPEEESCLDSIKVEDLNLEAISAVQSKMLEQWKPEELDVQRQDPNSELSCTGLTQGEKQHSECLKQPQDVAL